MFSFNKKSKGSAEIHFTSDAVDNTANTGRSVWKTNENVKGYAVFKLPPGVEFARSKIVLKGVVSTRTDDTRPGSLQRSWRTEKLPFLAVALDSRATAGFKSDNGLVKIPFSFNLEEANRFTDIPDLPPSVDSDQDAKWWSGLKKNEAGLEYNIIYSITATSYTSRDVISSKTERLNVLPVSEPQPPAYASHFAGEYFLADSSSRDSKQQRRQPHLQVAGQEPESIRLDPASHAARGSTDVPFVLKLKPEAGESLSTAMLPSQCELTARLVTRTLVSPNGTKRVPTVEEINHNNDFYMRTFRSNDQSFTLSIPDWTQYTDSAEEQFALTKFSFRFKINDDRHLGPNFFTSILSRQHEIEIKLSFPGSSLGSLELSLPAQVVFEEDAVELVRIVTK